MITHYQYEKAKQTIAEYKAERKIAGYVLLEEGLLVPEYAKTLDGTVLILSIGVGKKIMYYRPAGSWSITFVIKQNKIICTGGVSGLVGEELFPATRKEYLESNQGYVI